MSEKCDTCYKKQLMKEICVICGKENPDDSKDGARIHNDCYHKFINKHSFAEFMKIAKNPIELVGMVERRCKNCGLSYVSMVGSVADEEKLCMDCCAKVRMRK